MCLFIGLREAHSCINSYACLLNQAYFIFLLLYEVLRYQILDHIINNNNNGTICIYIYIYIKLTLVEVVKEIITAIAFAHGNYHCCDKFIYIYIHA